MNRHERRYRKKVDLEDLKEGPVRHMTLPPMLMTRIQRLQGLFSDVLGIGMGEWVEGFQRDMHPVREVEIWETMARSYQAFITGRDLSLEARKEVFGLILARCCGDWVKALSELKHLSLEDAKKVLRS